MLKDTNKCEILKERVAKKQQEIAIMEEIEDQHCEAAQNELEEYRTLKEKIEAALNSEVASIEPIKSIEEVKSITLIKDIVNGNQYPARYGRRRRRRRNRF